MTKIKLNGIEHEFRFSFKAIKSLLIAENLKLEDLTEWGQNLANLGKIAHYGTGQKMTIAEIEEALDLGSWEDALQIITAFGEELGQYFATEKKNLPTTSE